MAVKPMTIRAAAARPKSAGVNRRARTTNTRSKDKTLAPVARDIQKSPLKVRLVILCTVIGQETPQGNFWGAAGSGILRPLLPGAGFFWQRIPPSRPRLDHPTDR